MSLDFLRGTGPQLSAAIAFALALIVAFGIAEITARLVARALRRLASVTPGDPVSATIRTLTRIIRVAVFLLVAALLTTPSINLAGVKIPVGLTFEQLSVWFFASGLRIALIMVLAVLVTRVFRLLVTRLEHEAESKVGVDSAEHLRRIRTLGNLLYNIVSMTVLAIATLMILRQLNIDIMPILTGAGIVGLAIGFGAQTLVKDVISGFFVIFENQVRVGDAATINGTGGAVESITLRTIALRDVSGTVHVFPHGSVTTLANHTKDFSYYVIDLGVSYKEDVDQVIALLKDVGASLLADPKYGKDVLEPLEIFGVENFTATEVLIKMRIKTRPTRQWGTGRELRRRIKKAFDAHGIEFPGQRVSLSLGPHTVALAPHAPDTPPPRDGAQNRDEPGKSPPR